MSTADGSAARRPPTDPEGPTGRLATWVGTTALADVPGEVVERAKHLILDGLGCALVGARLPASITAVEALTALEPDGPAALVGWDGRSTSASTAALLNSSFVQGFELDDFSPRAPLHNNSLILPALLAVLSRPEPVGGDRFVLGAILGYEVGPRVGLALHGGEMLSRGWHSGPVFGTHSAAVAVGALHGADPAAVEDALGIAGTQSGGLMAAQFESDVKRMQHGFAARAGLTAATLAAGGYVGIKRVFEREYGGYLSVFGEGHDPDPGQVAAGLGETWHTMAVAVKVYAAMGGLHGAIDAALELRPRVSVDRISHIDVEVGEVAYGKGGWTATRPLEVIGAQMNLGYAVAVALLDGDALARQFSPARINDDDVWALIDKTEVRHQRRFDQLPGEEYLTTRVTLTLDGSSTRCSTITHPRGTGKRPLTNAEIVRKYRTLTGPILEAGRQGDLERCVLGLDEVTDARDLLALLVPAVPSILD